MVFGEIENPDQIKSDQVEVQLVDNQTVYAQPHYIRHKHQKVIPYANYN